MRAVLQRVCEAAVRVDGQVVGEIGQGLLVLLGVRTGDGDPDACWMAEKVASMRIFQDEAGKMNRSVLDVGGAVLAVSQFTLLADPRKGRRPSFIEACAPDEANRLYELFCAELRSRHGLRVETGRFGAEMKVSLVNDGPITLIVDDRQRSGA